MLSDLSMKAYSWSYSHIMCFARDSNLHFSQTLPIATIEIEMILVPYINDMNNENPIHIKTYSPTPGCFRQNIKSGWCFAMLKRRQPIVQDKRRLWNSQITVLSSLYSLIYSFPVICSSFFLSPLSRVKKSLSLFRTASLNWGVKVAIHYFLIVKCQRRSTSDFSRLYWILSL